MIGFLSNKSTPIFFTRDAGGASGPAGHDWSAIVSGWANKDDALTWAESRGMTVEQLGDSVWLMKKAARHPPDGIGKSLNGLYRAISTDSRFQTDGRSDFSRFREFLGFGAKIDFKQLV